MLESRLNRILSDADATSIPRVILLRRKLWHSTCTARCIASLDFAKSARALLCMKVSNAAEPPTKRSSTFFTYHASIFLQGSWCRTEYGLTNVFAAMSVMSCAASAVSKGSVSKSPRISPAVGGGDHVQGQHRRPRCKPDSAATSVRKHDIYICPAVLFARHDKMHSSLVRLVRNLQEAFA